MLLRADGANVSFGGDLKEVGPTFAYPEIRRLFPCRRGTARGRDADAGAALRRAPMRGKASTMVERRKSVLQGR